MAGVFSKFVSLFTFVALALPSSGRAQEENVKISQTLTTQNSSLSGVELVGVESSSDPMASGLWWVETMSADSFAKDLHAMPEVGLVLFLSKASVTSRIGMQITNERGSKMESDVE